MLWHGERNWNFWIDWYEKCLAGAPQDWEGLLTDIALIPSEDWGKGPEHVAELIAQLQRKYELKEQVRSVKEELAASVSAEATAAQRGHNNPPELIETELRRELVVVWERLDKAEKELEKPEPSPSKLASIATFLIETAGRILSYCGGKLDKAVDEAVRELGRAAGKWAIPLGAGLWATQAESVQALGRAMLEYARTLPGGPF